MQATKWLKLPLFLTPGELAALLEACGAPAIVPLSGIFPHGKELLSVEEYAALYGTLLDALKRGEEPKPDRKLVSAWTLDPMDVEEKKTVSGSLVKPVRPVVLVQPYWLNYSLRDSKFHEMAFSRESLSWGLLFSFPQLFQDPETLDIVQVKEPEFPNAHLFKKIRAFSRSHTLPTPFSTPAGEVNHPARIGKEMLPIAREMPQLKKKGARMPLKAEVVAIGDELLNGRIVNGNSAYISRKLTALGFDVSRQISLPDDPALLEEGLSESLACAPLVIATGGLGPTLDDHTRKVAADLFHTELAFNPSLAASMQERFGEIPSLEDQATVPARAEILPNHLGTASGLILCGRESTLILLPGVPHEMEELMEREVLPYIKRCFDLETPEAYEELHFFKAYESEFDPLLRQLQEEHSFLKIGIYPRNGLVSITLKGLKEDVELAKAKIRFSFASHEYLSQDGKIETAVHALLLQKKCSLSLAESCTGGAISSRLVALPGASGYLLGSVVAYSNALKESLLQVPSSLLKEKGAVSSETASAMAEGIEKLTGSDYSLAITGIAGPDGGSPEKPVGTLYIAVKEKGTPARAARFLAFGSRAMIIDCSASFALAELYRAIR